MDYKSLDAGPGKRSASPVTAVVATATKAAATAFPAWSALGPNERRLRLARAADALTDRASDFIDAMAAEIGATRAWAGFNVKLASGMLREAAAMTTQIGGEVIPSDHPHRISMAFRQPAGVCLGIAPWNAPVILGVRAFAMPLACGNTVILKASEVCPKTHTMLGNVIAEAGLGRDVLTVVTHAPEDAAELVRALIEHPVVRRVNFTGSTRVGRIVGEIAGRMLKPALLELGGKAPLIVLEDADLEQAVNAAAFGAYMNQGQICMSTERVIIDERVADEFVSRLVAKAASLSVGDPSAGNVNIGRLISNSSISRVSGMLDDAQLKGAKLFGGERIADLIMKPAVIDHVTPTMAIYYEESFAPVVTIVRVNGIEQAVEAANDTEYGLAAAIFTRDIARALRIMPRVLSGSFHINGPTVQDEAQVPFGGMKGSGYGRFGGKGAIAEFTDTRWVTIETEAVHYPF